MRRIEICYIWIWWSNWSYF